MYAIATMDINIQGGGDEYPRLRYLDITELKGVWQYVFFLTYQSEPWK